MQRVYVLLWSINSPPGTAWQVLPETEHFKVSKVCRLSRCSCFLVTVCSWRGGNLCSQADAAQDHGQLSRQAHARCFHSVECATIQLAWGWFKGGATETFVFMQTTSFWKKKQKKLGERWPECVRFEHHSVLTEDQSGSSKKAQGSFTGAPSALMESERQRCYTTSSNNVPALPAAQLTRLFFFLSFPSPLHPSVARTHIFELLEVVSWSRHVRQ